jgi:hypothetical protein
MILNGMELLVLNLVPTEKSYKMVSAFAHKVNSRTVENVSIIQLVKMELNGMVNNVLVYHVFQVLHSPVGAAAVKLQFMLVQPVLIGMVIDAFMLQISVQQV